MRKLHITNEKQRDATVGMVSGKPDPTPHMGLPGEEINYQRYTGASESGLHDSLVQVHGEDYAQALIEGDPEIDMDFVGQRIGRSDKIYLSHGGKSYIMLRRN